MTRGLVLALLLLACGRTRTYEPRPPGCGGMNPCDDGVACTIDVCLPDGTCRFTPDDGRCAGLFCTLDAQCNPTRGCVGAPRDCDNGISCDLDTCDEATKTCKHSPDNTKCPMGQVCAPEGCRDCRDDADCNDAVECTRDVCTAGRCSHTVDVSLCDDGSSCTADACDPMGACTHAPNDALCNDNIACTTDRCLGAQGCGHTPVSSRCDDGKFCNGVEVCDVQRGCVPGPPPVCMDAISCTVDRCDVPTDKCVATPDDSLCPRGHFCGPMGCQVFAYAVATSGLYDVRLPAGVATLVAPTRRNDAGPDVTLNDIAVDLDGGMYGMQGSDLVTVDRFTGKVTFVRNLGDTLNALDVIPGGALLGSGVNRVFSVNRSTGALTAVASLPSGMSASGDIAVVQGRVFITTVSAVTVTDRLVEVFLDGGAARVIGDTGVDCLWGLSAYGASLYGFDCNGSIHSIDLSTGRATALTTGGPSWWGASAR